MHKRILAIATLLCAVPLIASAWTLNTWVRSQGGNIQVGNYAKSTVLTGSTFKSYTSTNGYNAVVTADANYFINNLIIDGVPTTPTTSTSATIVVPSGASSIWVDFLRNQLTFNVVAGTNGIVTPSGAQPNVYAGATYRVFSFIPAKGQSVTAVTADVPGNIIFSTTALNQVNKKVIVTVSKITGNVTLTGTFSGSVVTTFSAFSTATNGTKYKAAAACDACHIAQGVDSGRAILVNYSASGHKANAHGPVCAVCHVGSSTGAHPGQVQCTSCHTATLTVSPAPTAAIWANSCAYCHTSTAPGSNLHNPVQYTSSAKANAGCVDCHNMPIAQHAVYNPATHSDVTLVGDNSGVRSITQEFSKWSHHVTGVALNDAHCAACHLEGTVSAGKIVIDPTKHMVDAKIHLRNVSDDSDMAWDPATPNFTTMDNFCLTCHSSTGATSTQSGLIQGLITPLTGKTASATNPFGDTISNGYDQMQRPAVVDVSSQFSTSNPSHHAVLGKRYTGRTRIGSVRSINSATFTANSSATLAGPRTTIYDAGKFNALYSPLGTDGTAATGLGDDSTLHCGDCHTVGQWKPGSSVNADGTPTPVAIGAHGSNNEYMLRNSIGTDARHQSIKMQTNLGGSNTYYPDTTTPYLVCYNCHTLAAYGTGQHIGEQNVGESNCNTSINTNAVNAIGIARLNSQNNNTYVDDDGLNQVFGQPWLDAGTPTARSNIYGIQCNNCHNSGISAGNIFGGIHGAKDATYTDGAGNTTKHERFLPGLGNVMYVPGTRGGITGGSPATITSYKTDGTTVRGTYTYTTGGVTSDLNWEEATRTAPISGSHNPSVAGCYTLAADQTTPAAAGNGEGGVAGLPASAGLKAPDGTTLLYGNWGGCADHAQPQGASIRATTQKTSVRPVNY